MTQLTSDMPVESLRLGFIGAGRLGCALAWSLAQRGVSVHAVASRSESGAAALAEPIEGCRILMAQAVVDTCDLVFITTSDAGIAPVARSLRWRPGMGVVHCSGATEVDALASAAAAGALIGGFHPMQTFSDPAAAVRSLPGCMVTVEADPVLQAVLARLVARLDCTVNVLPPGMRARYHAAGGYASQFVNVLLAEGARIWASWGGDEEDAMRALLPLLKGTVSAIESAGLDKGMPGPVSRGDVGTVAGHVQALTEMDADAIALYRALCRRTVPLALRAERISAATAQEIQRVLDE
ncbi:MAG: DUF2520 domain-containing protein [Alcaligenaceae bacterium]|nr:DUF2520 domain-containing protein [Alcaligenaceae bacterium]